jgi:hypothetical protein
MFYGVGFVNEFHCEDRASVAGRNCFLNSGILLISVEELIDLKLTMHMLLYRLSWI